MAQAEMSNSELKAVLEFVSLHARIPLNQEQWGRQNQFNNIQDLKRLRQLFQNTFVVDSKFEALKYSESKNRYDSNYRLLADDVRAWSNWGLLSIAEESPFFYPIEDLPSLYSPIETRARNWQLLVPLRLDEDLVIFLASPGPSRAGFGQYMPSHYILGLGIRLDDLELAQGLSTAHTLQYFLTLNSMSVDEITEAAQKQISRYPELSNLTFSSYGDWTKLYLNLAARDLRQEALDLIHRASKKTGYELTAQDEFENGGIGFINGPDGRQYLVQSMFISNTVVDETVSFIKNLIHPTLHLNRKIWMPTDIPRAQAALKKMKKKVSAKEALNALRELQSRTAGIKQSPEAISQALYDRLRLGGCGPLLTDDSQ